MLTTLLIIVFLLLLASALFLLILRKQKQHFGILSGNRIYQDTDKLPGEILTSAKYALIGKPDYLIQQKNMIIPVEIKTGKTPAKPYSGHIMQLMAYCHLVEEAFNIRPAHGILKYPEKEFVINYSPEYEALLKKIIDDILEFKVTDYGDYFTSKSFGICTKCKEELREL